MAESQITITVPANLSQTEDQFLAALWHVAQFNPAPTCDKQAGDLVAHIGWEIIRRWLRATGPEMYHHQQKHHYWDQLRRFAKYEPGPEGNFDGGQWVPRDLDAEAAENGGAS